MVERAKKINIVSGLLQLAGVVCLLLLPLFIYETKNYPTKWIQGWQAAIGYVREVDVLTVAAEQLGLSLLLLFLCTGLAALAGLVAAVLALTGKIHPLLPTLLSVAALAAVVVVAAVNWQKLDGTEYSFGSAAFAGGGCLLLSIILGFVSVGVHAAANKKVAPVPAMHEKLPDVSDKIEQKKYYQVVEQETAPAGEEGAVVPPYVPGSAPRGVMVGLAGVYAGVEIPFQPGETIKVGRDAASNLIYDKRAPRISRHHCEITWNPQSQNYSILDTSTNGTFKNGSEDCLPQNMRIVLEVGCTISLGNEDNVFRLE